MDPDVFILIAFCTEVALFAIGGGLFVGHEWRRQALGVDADRRELSRLAGRPHGPSSGATRTDRGAGLAATGPLSSAERRGKEQI